MCKTSIISAVQVAVLNRLPELLPEIIATIKVRKNGGITMVIISWQTVQQLRKRIATCHFHDYFFLDKYRNLSCENGTEICVQVL